jgi:putative inorganic carbon (HCO3(-)) transporter
VRSLEVGCLAAAAFAAPLVWGRSELWPEREYAGHALVLGLACIAWLARIFQWLIVRRQFPVAPTPLDWPAAALLGWTAISALVSENPHASSLATTRLVTGILLFGLLAKSDPDPLRRRAVAAGLLIAGSLAALVGIRSYVYSVRMGDPSWRIFGTFYNPNVFAGFLMLAIPLSISALLAARSGIIRILCGYALLTLITALVLTGSRGGWLAFLLSAVVFGPLLGVALGRRRQGAVAGLVAVVVLVGLAIALPPLRVRLLTSFSAQEHSNRFRLLTWEAALQMVLDRPVQGFGPGSFELAFPKYAIGGYTRMAHENYLQIAAETGLPGLLAFVWLLGAFIFSTTRALSSAGNREVALLMAACVSGVAAFAFHSFLDYGWFIGAIASTVWLLMGLGLGSMREGKQTRTRPVRMSAGAAWTVVAGLAAVALILESIPARAFVAQTHSTRCQELMQQGMREAAIEQCRMATAWDPWNARYRKQLAWLLPFKEAEKEMKQAIMLEPTQPAHRAALAQLYRENGRNPEALQLLREAIYLHPNYTSAYMEMADINLRKGRVAPAESIYKQVVRIEGSPYGQVTALEGEAHPDFIRARYMLGSIRLARGDKAGALEHLAKDLDLIQRWEAFSKPRAAMAQSVGEGEPGLVEEMRSLKGRLLFRMAEVENAMGAKAEAARKLDEAKRVFPGVQEAVAREDSELKSFLEGKA